MGIFLPNREVLRLERIVRLTHLAILNERLVDELGVKSDLTVFFQRAGPEKGFVQSLTDRKTTMSAQHNDLVILQRIRNLICHLWRAGWEFFGNDRIF